MQILGVLPHYRAPQIPTQAVYCRNSAEPSATVRAGLSTLNLPQHASSPHLPATNRPGTGSPCPPFPVNVASAWWVGPGALAKPPDFEMQRTSTTHPAVLHAATFPGARGPRYHHAHALQQTRRGRVPVSCRAPSAANIALPFFLRGMEVPARSVWVG